MKKILIIIAVFASTASFAQRSFWSFNYPMSFSLGEQADYISESSFRGIGLDGRFFIDTNISVGGSWSWEVFDEIKRGLPPTQLNLADEGDNIQGTVSGVQYRFLNTIPIMVNGHYYLGSNGAMRTYFGLAVGTSYVEQRTDVGFISILNKKWGFAIQPEVGVVIPFGLSGTGLNVAGRFRYTTKTSDTIPVSFFTLAVGLAFIN